MTIYQHEIGDRFGLWSDQPPIEVVARFHGGFGAVYIARMSGGELTALKTIRADRLGSPGERDAFSDEVLTWLTFPRHVNVLQALGLRRYNDLPYAQIEYVPPINGRGASAEALLTEMRAGEYLTPPFAALVVAQVLEGLAEIEQHSPRFWHGDIKPSNIMIAGLHGIDPRDRTFDISAITAKVTDFGLARAHDGKAGRFGGDVRYLAPEALSALGLMPAANTYGLALPRAPDRPATRDTADFRRALDIYAIGCTAFELLFGRPCQRLEEDGTRVVSHAEMHDRMPAEYFMVPLQAKPLVDVVYAMLAADPADRYESFAVARERWRSAIAEMGLTVTDRDRPPASPADPLGPNGSARLRYLTERRGLTEPAARRFLRVVGEASRLRSLGDHATSQRLLLELSPTAPGSPFVLADVAHGLMSVDRFPEAMNVYLLAIGGYLREPLLRGDHLGFGACCANLTQLVGITGALPKFPDFLEHLRPASIGEFAITLGRLAVEELPHSSHAHAALALALLSWGDLDEGAAEARVAGRNDPALQFARWVHHIAAGLGGEPAAGLPELTEMWAATLRPTVEVVRRRRAGGSGVTPEG